MGGCCCPGLRRAAVKQTPSSCRCCSSYLVSSSTHWPSTGTAVLDDVAFVFMFLAVPALLVRLRFRQTLMIETSVFLYYFAWSSSIPSTTRSIGRRTGLAPNRTVPNLGLAALLFLWVPTSSSGSRAVPGRAAAPRRPRPAHEEERPARQACRESDPTSLSGPKSTSTVAKILSSQPLGASCPISSSYGHRAARRRGVRDREDHAAPGLGARGLCTLRRLLFRGNRSAAGVSAPCSCMGSSR